MEIVPIIYNILIFGGVILTLVIIISFLMSKSARKQENSQVQERYLTPQPMYIDHNSTQGHLIEQRPVIIPITAIENKDLQVVRKQSYEEYDMRATNGGRNGNRRYTILNEELKNSHYRYVNEG